MTLNYRFGVLALLTLIGCSFNRVQKSLSYEGTLKQAEVALKEERVREARGWVEQALQMNPGGHEAEVVMAKILDQEIAQEKSLLQHPLPEELLHEERRLQIKTWLERSQGFLEVQQFEEALLAAEQVFQLDPENREASHLVDKIKEEARQQGKEDSLFLQDLYQEEIDSRVKLYAQQAETWFQSNKPGAARLAAEKTLLLDPDNKKGLKILSLLERKEKKTLPSKTFTSPND